MGDRILTQPMYVYNYLEGNAVKLGIFLETMMVQASKKDNGQNVLEHD